MLKIKLNVKNVYENLLSATNLLIYNAAYLYKEGTE